MYEAFYGLNEKPFNLTPDPSFLFLSEKHKEAFAHLLYGVRNRNGFVMVSGEIGTGKTTICRSLLSRLDPESEVAFIFNPRLSPQELLKTINEEFGIASSARSMKDLIDELNAHLLARTAEGKNCILVIDEAQSLTPSVLEQIRLLSNLETERQKLLQIILVGQPELAEMLELPELRQLNQRITARYHLRELNFDETLHYIAYRLRIAGGRRKVRFTRSAVRTVYASSSGTPRLINAICDRALLIGYTLEKHQITRGIIKKAVKEIRGEKVRRKTGRILRPALPAPLYLAFLIPLLIMFFVIVPRDLMTVDGLNDLWNSGAARWRDAAAEPEEFRVEARVRDYAAIAPAELRIPDEPEWIEVVLPVAVDPEVVPSDEMASPEPATSIVEEAVESVTVLSIISDVSLREAIADRTRSTCRNDGLDAIMSEWDTTVASAYPAGHTLEGVAAFANLNGFSFVELTATFDQVIVVNLPVLMELRGPQADLWVGVVKVNEKYVRIATGKERFHDVRADEIRSRYTGKVAFLWVDPEPGAAMVLPWTRGPNVAKIQDKLHALGLLKGETYGAFDRKTINAIRRVQAMAGLWVDGIVGRQTRMVLASWLEEPATPALGTEAFPDAARKTILAYENQLTAIERPQIQESISSAPEPAVEVVEEVIETKIAPEEPIATSESNSPAGLPPVEYAIPYRVDAGETRPAESADSWEPQIFINELDEPMYRPTLQSDVEMPGKDVTEPSAKLYPLVPSPSGNGGIPEQ
ncbi:MAG: AAA family ATPase [Candidatus Hydrogenedentes bacterium]|nr:AAA family ATPase [Candidatus Hydrogenedentota bacterium]